MHIDSNSNSQLRNFSIYMFSVGVLRYLILFLQSCKIALRLIGPRLGSSAINNMFQKHLIEGGQLHYGEFMNDLSRLIVSFLL